MFARISPPLMGDYITKFYKKGVRRMSRLEIAIWWVSVWAFVLIISNLIISEIDKAREKKKVKAHRSKIQVEVYKKSGNKFNRVG